MSNQPAPAPAKKKLLGPPLKWSASDLDSLASISGADQLAAEALWKELAPKQFKALLEAQPVEDNGNSSNGPNS